MSIPLAARSVATRTMTSPVLNLSGERKAATHEKPSTIKKRKHIKGNLTKKKKKNEKRTKEKTKFTNTTGRLKTSRHVFERGGRFKRVLSAAANRDEAIQRALPFVQRKLGRDWENQNHNQNHHHHHHQQTSQKKTTPAAPRATASNPNFCYKKTNFLPQTTTLQ